MTLIISVVLFYFLISARERINALEAAEKAKERTIEEIQRELNYKKHHIEESSRRIRESLVGARVIVKSNEDEPYHLGVVQRYEGVGVKGQPLPVIVFDNDPKEYLCFSAVVPFNEEILKTLAGLDNKQQWEMMRNLGVYWE